MISAPKLMILLAVIFFVVGVPAMTFVAASFARRRRGEGDDRRRRGRGAGQTRERR